MIEFAGTWDERPALFIAPAQGVDPEHRALLVLQWFLSTLPKIIGRKDRLGGKKPLNPFLGELFLGHWDDDNGRTELVIEQVGHHPPVTASFLANKIHGVTLQGYSGQKTSFSGSVDISQSGHAVLHLDKFNEDYVITLCNMHIKGILSGSPYPELGGETNIYSSTGFTSHIEYAGKGWVSGKEHRLTAKLFKTLAPKDPLYTVSGEWSKPLIFRDVKRNNCILDTSHIEKAPRSPLIVADLVDQDRWESRRAWSAVADAIVRGDVRGAGHAKSVIENGQRQMRMDERYEFRNWKQLFFSQVQLKQLPFVEKVAVEQRLKLEEEKTLGIWRFDERKLAEAERPFRGSLTPAG